jgi:hypothetical protein
VFYQIPGRFFRHRMSTCLLRLPCAPCLFVALIVAIVLLLLQRTRSNNYQYRHRHYIAVHQQPLFVALRQNISLSPSGFFQVANPRNVLFCNVAQRYPELPSLRLWVLLEGNHSSSRSSLHSFEILRNISTGRTWKLRDRSKEFVALFCKQLENG